MAIKLIAQIMEEVDLPRPQTAILLAMAENAWDDGSHCFPSVDRIAWKAGYKYRQVINLIRQLESSGVIRKVEEARRHRATEYHIDISAAPKKMSFEDWKIANGRSNSRGAISQQEESRGAISQHLGVQSRNLGVQSIAPEPLVEPLEKTLTNVAPSKIESPSILITDNSTPGVVVAEVNGETIVGVDPAMTTDDMFEAFWSAYPKPVAGRSQKKASSQKFKVALKKVSFEDLMAALEWWKQTDKWKRDGGQYIDGAQKWLNQEMWLDAEEARPAETNVPRPNRYDPAEIDRRMKEQQQEQWNRMLAMSQERQRQDAGV